MHFPLGVYHALGARTTGRDSRREPEWPPSPVRLIGALLDAAHGQPGGAAPDALTTIDELARAAPPTIHAPLAGAQPGADEVAVLRGASQWAPRNPAKAELTGGLSLRDLAGPRAPVDKGGVAIGDQRVSFVWDDLDLTATQRALLDHLAADIAWIGTSRSPVVLRFAAEPPPDDLPHWHPQRPGTASGNARPVRVPTGRTVEAFDLEFARRRATKPRVEPSGLQKPASAGVTVAYATASREDVKPPHDPEHWGQAYVLAIHADSEVRPKAPSAYLVARATRAALLAQFGSQGDEGDAPSLLRGRDATPHAAIVPLPFVGGERADGSIKGVAIVLPHARRLDGDVTEIDAVEQGLRRLLESDGEGPGVVHLLGTGSLRLVQYDPVNRPLATLDLDRYTGPSATWTTVTPVVHSRWRSAKSTQALVDQAVADCSHVGLPTPEHIEVLRTADLTGAPPAFIDRRSLRNEWLGPISGPAQHLRLTFPRPIRGPVLLGRARHFGLGLMRPWHEEAR